MNDNINLLVCITETECIYCAVRTESIPTIRVNNNLVFLMDNSSIFSSFSSPYKLAMHSPLMLHSTADGPKLQCDSVACSSATFSGAGTLQRIQRQFVSLCLHRFPSHHDYSYGNVLNCLELHTLSDRWRYLGVLS
jgi:hypothetical protein